MGTIFDRVIGALFWLACILIAFSMLSVNIEILYRFFTGQAQLWVIEVSEYILLMMTFLGAAWVLKKDGHVRIDVLINRLEPRTQTILNIVTSVVGAIFCLIIVWYGTDVTWENFQKGTTFYKAVGFPKAPIMAAIPIGSFLLFIQFLRRTRGYLMEWKAPQYKEDEAIALQKLIEQL